MNRLIKKINTLRTNPIGVYNKYKVKFIIELKGGISPIPIYDTDYDRHWNFTTFKNKAVLDLGADYGSTAYYFLQKGAIKVIAVEGDPQLASKLKENCQRFKKIVPVETFIDSSEKIEKLISDYHPDLVKVDIEGYEKLLLNVHNIAKVKEWLIEPHSNEIYERLKEFFVSNEFNVRCFQHNNVKILHVLRC
jgi:precorrin-6B methylase 2